LYQSESVPKPEGTANVWEMLESPLVGLVEPSLAQYVPLWQPLVVTDSAPPEPEVAHPLRFPVSNPPLTIPPPELLTVQVNEALPEAPVVSVAVTVTEDVPAVVGVPLIRPLELLIESPGGNPLAE
jgi:hypothetical protein